MRNQSVKVKVRFEDEKVNLDTLKTSYSPTSTVDRKYSDLTFRELSKLRKSKRVGKSLLLDFVSMSSILLLPPVLTVVILPILGLKGVVFRLIGVLFATLYSITTVVRGISSEFFLEDIKQSQEYMDLDTEYFRRIKKFIPFIK